jgi:HEAT repeat protein
MKHKIITILLISIFLVLSGMAIYAQSTDMSYYTGEFQRSTATYFDRLEVLKTVQDANLTGIGDFYHEALKYVIIKIPDIKTIEDKEHTESAAKILCNGLADEKYTAAAPEIWQIVQFSDTVRADNVRDVNDGTLMQEALVALGQVGNKDYVPNIALRLDNYNSDVVSDVETRRRAQRGVAGCINALEALHDLAGYSSVFFASIGWYDPAIKTIAYNALPNIVEDPGEIIGEIILNFSNNPEIKYTAWQEMLRTRAPDDSKAKVAAIALGIGWSYPTSDQQFQRILREMRMSAIDTIRALGAADDSVYPNLDKSYSTNYASSSPNYDEIRKTLSALSALKTDEAVQLLVKFLSGLNERRRSGIWTNKERDVFSWVIPSLGATKTNSAEARQLLTFIERSSDYTGTEQNWARTALRDLDR